MDGMSTQACGLVRPAAEDPMPLNGIDHVEFCVGNAKQAAFYFCQAFGFREVAYAGLETGVRDRTSHVAAPGPHHARAHGRAGVGLPDRRAPPHATATA